MWQIIQPISWRSRPKRFLIWKYQTYEAYMFNILTGEKMWRPTSPADIGANWLD